MRIRPYAVAAAAAVLVTTAGTVVSPAQAVPPESRTITDAVEPGKAYDIVKMTMRAAPRANRPAVIKVHHGRKVSFGDAIDAWFDLDGDKVPDVHLSGSSFSEYVVFKAKSFTKDGKDISNRDCVRLSMAGKVSKIRLFPECVGSPASFAVSVRSSADQAPSSTDDWAPRTQRFTKKVLALTAS